MKKIYALVMVLGIVGALVAGCSGSSDTATDANATTNNAAANTTTP